MRIVAIRPGVVDTDMQGDIRASEGFPLRADFVAMKERGQLTSAADAARAVLAIVHADDFGGAPLIAQALDVTETPALAARVVVTRSPEVAELACKAGVKTILHSLPGRNDTVRLGLEALLSELPGLAGCIFLPGDQPLLRKESLEAMARDFSALDEKERAILRLGFRAEDGTERLGSPVLFGSSYFGALCSLPEGKGGGVVIRRHPESVRAVYAARQEELEDADTVEELERLRRLL